MDSQQANQFRAARAERLRCQAELTRLEYYCRASQLVSANEVRIARAKAAAIIRTCIMESGSRIAAQIPETSDRAVIQAFLEGEARKTLDQIVTELNRKLGKEHQEREPG